MRRVARGVAESMGASASVDFRVNFAPLVNDPEQADFALSVCRDLVGAPQVVTDAPLIMASEDFSYMLEKVPGCFINIGNGTGSQGGCMVHNAGYDFNDRVLSTGATYWVKLVERWLAPQAG